MIATVEASRALLVPSVFLMDVRPPRERYHGGLGFIPGSLRAPAPQDLQSWAGNGRGRPSIVAVCQSELRSRRWCEEAQGYATAAQLPPLRYLAGGVLAWAARGLPLAGVAGIGTDPAMDMPCFRRQLKACFVAQAVESASAMQPAGTFRVLQLTTPSHPAADPLSLLKDCFRWAQAAWDTSEPLALADVLDEAARQSQFLGTPIDVVSDNLDRLMRRLPLANAGSIA